MMLKSSTAVQTRTLRAGAAAPRVACPSAPRSSVIRHFKEDDKLETKVNSAPKTGDGQGTPVTREEHHKAFPNVKDLIVEGDSVRDQTSATSKELVQVAPWIPAFTRRREVYIGRIAQLGIAACAALEVLTPEHYGPIQQLRITFGLENAQIVSLISAVIAYNVIGAVGPWSPTYSEANQRDVAKRPAGPPNQMVSPFDVQKFLGISGWGWTKRNELFNGRLAMLGFWAAFNNEMVTGKGPLGQVAVALGIVPDDSFYSTAGKAGLAFFGLMVAFSFILSSSRQGEANAENDIY